MGGGEGGIRTHGGFDTTLLFESSTLNRSDTSPREIVPKLTGGVSRSPAEVVGKCTDGGHKKAASRFGSGWYSQ